MKSTHYPYVFIGGGMASGTAIQTLIKEKVPGREIALITLEPELPYNRPSLSKGYLAEQEKRSSLFIEPQAFYDDHNITVKLATRVVDLKPRTLELTTETDERITFDRLLIATGARPRWLGVPGADLGNILMLRTVADSDALKASAQTAKQAVVVGAGFIGLEVAAYLASRGIGVTVLHRGTQLLDRFATPEMAQFFHDYFVAHGVTFRYETTVDHFIGEQGFVTKVITDKGDQLPADTVVIGIGVELALDFAKDQTLRMENGIVVDEQLETSIPGIFAAGDVANFPDLLFGGKRRRIEHWDHAQATGRTAVMNMLGKREDFRHLSYFFSDMFDLSFELWGDTDAPDDTVFTNEAQGKTAAGWYLRDGKLVAYFASNRPRNESDQARNWIESGQPVTRAMITA